MIFHQFEFVKFGWLNLYASVKFAIIKLVMLKWLNLDG